MAKHLELGLIKVITKVTIKGDDLFVHKLLKPNPKGIALRFKYEF